jgi:putative acetyltransferase
VPAAITIESPDQPEVLELLRLGDEFGLAMYGEASYYGLALDKLLEPGVTFFVARVARTTDAAAVGTAALVDRGDGTAELKRMFVHPGSRGAGVASQLLAAVEREAAASGISLLQLETGPKQPEAIALYEKHGYQRIDNFAPYIGDPDSYCMERALTPGTSSSE